MNLKNQPPVFVPSAFSDEIEMLSKAALMDMAWDYAMQIAGTDDHEKIMNEFRSRREIVMNHRRQAKAEWQADEATLRKLADANRAAERDHPLQRCVHGSALIDGGGECLEPPCGCRAKD